jgi:hypothetical protein
MTHPNNEIWIEMPSLENGKPVLRIRIPPNPQPVDEEDSFSYNRTLSKNIWTWLDEFDPEWVTNIKITDNFWNLFSVRVELPEHTYIAFAENPIMYKKFKLEVRNLCGWKDLDVYVY